MDAIDLYSGSGGWRLGLSLAGHSVRQSYEWWGKATLTHNSNFGGQQAEVDIRQLDVEDLPDGIDLVVGSPPCTQFSYANRGGNGDIQDGLIDVAKFLEAVAYIRPRYWVMENVPRVAKVLARELEPGGSLAQYAYLVDHIEVMDMSEFGLPQRRKRMIAGSFPLELLNSYKNIIPVTTLGHVVQSLRHEAVNDPLWAWGMPLDELFDNNWDDFLDDEETRLNREAKEYHPVYNVMRFPDPMDNSVRTITATCTRVSRESVVVAENGGFRRLSVRERASLQGFPINFQFHGDSHSQKLKLIGNAIPPLFTYYLGCALEGIQPRNLTLANHVAPEVILANTPPTTAPEKKKNKYPEKRSFKLAIPGLRFGSGVRLDLANAPKVTPIRWTVQFTYGNSKAYKTILPGSSFLEAIPSQLVGGAVGEAVKHTSQRVRDLCKETSPECLQQVWTHREEGLHPFAVADELGRLAEKIIGTIANDNLNGIEEYIAELTSDNSAKIRKYSKEIFSGLIVGTVFNCCINR